MIRFRRSHPARTCAVEGGSKRWRGAAEFGGAGWLNLLSNVRLSRKNFEWAKTGLLAVPAAPPLGVLQAVAFALRLQDVAAVGQPIEGGPGQPLAAQHLGPVLERQVRGHDQAVPLVGRGDHVEQQFRPGLAGRHVAQFVEDQQVQLGKLLPQPQELPLLVGLQQQRDQLGHAEEADLACPGRRRPCPGRGQVRLAGAAGADQQDVLPLVEVLALDQLQHQRLVDAGPGREVELVEQSCGPGSGPPSAAARPPSVPARSAPARTAAAGTPGDRRCRRRSAGAIFSHSACIVGSFSGFRWCFSSTVLLVSVLFMAPPPSSRAW